MERGTKVYACLGCNLYLLRTNKGNAQPASLADFRKKRPICIRLPRDACQLRAATADDADRCKTGFNDRTMVYVEGVERSSAPNSPDLAHISLLLEVATPEVCASWVSAGSLLSQSWLSLLTSQLLDSARTATLQRLLSDLQPLSPRSTDPLTGAVHVLLGAKGRHAILLASQWLRPQQQSALLLAGASTVKKAVDAVDKVQVVGPLLRLVCLMVQISAASLQADAVNDSRTALKFRLLGLADALLRHMLDTLQQPEMGFVTVYRERLSFMLNDVESQLADLEVTIFLGRKRDAPTDTNLGGWGAKVDRLQDKLGQLRMQATEDPDRLDKKRSLLGRSRGGSSAVPHPRDSDLVLGDLRCNPPALDASYVCGAARDGRVEHEILGLLQCYSVEGGTEAPRVGICGVPGSGKSTACAGVAHHYVRKLDGRGAAWVRLTASSTRRTVAVAVIALAARLCGSDVAKRLLLLQREADLEADFFSVAANMVLSEQTADTAGWLVVIDNVLDRQRDLLRLLLRVVPLATAVLFSTRAQLTVESISGAHLVSLDALPEADARELLAKASGKNVVAGEDPFAAEDAPWVDAVVHKTARHALSLSIVGSMIAERGGAWRAVVEALETMWMQPSFERPGGLNDLDMHVSVRAGLDTSLALLPCASSREAFAACGVLPRGVPVRLFVLNKLWSSLFDDRGGVRDWTAVVDGLDGVVPPTGVEALVDALVRAGLLRREVDIKTGDWSSVTVHPVVGEYAQCLLGSDYQSAHLRLIESYLVTGSFVDGDGLRVYRFWDTPDDGYWLDHAAVHAAKSQDVGALLCLLKSEWMTERTQSCSVAAYQKDLDLVLAALLEVEGDKAVMVGRSRRVQYRVYAGLATAYINRVDGGRQLNAAMAVAAARNALPLVTRSESPTDWAAAQLLLGLACSSRVGRNTAAVLDEAIACFQLALEVWTADTAPREWAEAQHNLGTTLHDRCHRPCHGDAAVDMEAAVVCFEKELRVWTRGETSHAWAKAHCSLGSALCSLTRGNRGASIDAAIHHYTMALDVWTKDATPWEWAVTRCNLGIALDDRRTGDKDENFRAAIRNFRMAMEVWTQEVAPSEWAMTMYNLGRTYDRRVDNPAGRLADAVKCYKQALTVWTQKVPEAWADTSYNLLLCLGDMGGQTDAALVVARQLEEFGPSWTRWTEKQQLIRARVRDLKELQHQQQRRQRYHASSFLAGTRSLAQPLRRAFGV